MSVRFSTLPLLPALLPGLVFVAPACMRQDPEPQATSHQTSRESPSEIEAQREAEHEAKMAQLKALAEKLGRQEQELLEAQRLEEEQRVSDEAAQRQAIREPVGAALEKERERVSQEVLDSSGSTGATLPARGGAPDDSKSQEDHRAKWTLLRRDYRAAVSSVERLSTLLRICQTPTTSTTMTQGTQNWQTSGSAHSNTGEHVTGQSSGNGSSTSSSTTFTYNPQQCVPIVDRLQQAQSERQRIKQACFANFGPAVSVCAHPSHGCDMLER